MKIFDVVSKTSLNINSKFLDNIAHETCFDGQFPNYSCILPSLQQQFDSSPLSSSSSSRSSSPTLHPFGLLDYWIFLKEFLYMYVALKVDIFSLYLSSPSNCCCCIYFCKKFILIAALRTQLTAEALQSFLSRMVQNLNSGLGRRLKLPWPSEAIHKSVR